MILRSTLGRGLAFRPAPRFVAIAAVAGILAALAALAAFARPSAADETEWQFYPEIDTYVRLDDRNRLFFLLTRTRNDDFEATEGVIGAHLDHTLSSHLRSRVGYRYTQSVGSTGSQAIEHRVLLELTPRVHTPHGTLVSLRNRVELRWVDGDDSWRYRPRLKLQREFQTGVPRTLTPYASAEPFYDSRSDTWTRWQYQVGTEALLSRRVGIEAYLSIQDGTPSAPERLNAIGVVLNLFF